MTSQYHAHAYGGTLVGTGAEPSSSLAVGGALQMGGGMPYDPGPEHGRCHHRKGDGDYCQRYPKKGELYCPLHEPDDLPPEE